jgi:hypothetical protein
MNWLKEGRGIDHVEEKITATVYINGDMLGFSSYRLFT